MTWEIDADVWIERDEHGFARHLRHAQSPFSVAGVSDPYQLAISYLRQVGDEMGVTPEQLDHLRNSIPTAKLADQEGPICLEPGKQLRWWRRRDLRNETTVLVIQQSHDAPVRFKLVWPFVLDVTSLALNVYGSAIRVVLQRQGNGELVVTGATSTLRQDFNFKHAAALAVLTNQTVIGSPARASKNATKTLKDKSPVVKDGSLDAHVDIDGPTGQALLKFVLKGLGFNPVGVPAEFGFWIYTYQRAEGSQDVAGGIPAGALRSERQRFELMPNSDYPVTIMRHQPFGYDDEFRVGLDSPPVDIVSRFPDNAVLAAVPLMAGAQSPSRRPAVVHGLVFPVDPISATGYDLPSRPRRIKTLLPNRPASELDSVRKRVPLLRLDAATGSPRRRKLRGSHVVVIDPADVEIGSIGIAPPAEPPGRDFRYSSRSNHFAAVNAYYHLDGMFHRLEMFGLPFTSYAPAFFPKADIIHRAAIRPGPGGDGRCINAQIRIRPGQDLPNNSPADKLHRLEFRFALADLPPSPEADPLGIACDVRWIWHEFGHALIAGATGDLELPFAHSVGDALAAINCDPDSVLAEPEWARWKLRGVTFPWVSLPTRRHDREASQGWSWAGRLGQAEGYHQDMGDVAGYRREQVLSSTLFRLYRAIGGDAVLGSGMPDIRRRRAAADYVTYLIVRAIGSLGPGSASPATDASVFASALMDSDCGTLLFDYAGHPPAPVAQQRVGGTVHKVVRWAFEKQGLYARDERTAHGSGSPQPVDVYVDDGRRGEYQFTDDWTATSSALWLRRKADGGQRPQTPLRNADNFIYVRVWNRGYQTAFGVQVTVRAATAASNLGWPAPARWTSIAPVDPANATSDIGANDQVVLGPFKWTPTRRGDHTILVEVDAPGDRSNINVVTGMPCAQPAAQPTLLASLIPYDNNLGVTTWTVP